MAQERQYIAIDLKSFYASVECMERGLDPLNTNLVVADVSHTEKTICLAVSPSLKSYGIPDRPRLFEVIQKVREVNRQRRWDHHIRDFDGESYDFKELQRDPTKAVGYIVATPQMARYMEVSTQIYQVYLKYVSPDDIHVYSIDEVFIDATHYLATYKMTAHELAMTMIKDVLSQTGITATAGIGTNMYLAKIAMDIVAKKMPPDKDGVRIAELNEMNYRDLLWDHTPITDFWRVGRGYAKKLEANHMFTMGDIALCSVQNEDLLYDLFGVNAELLIDHAWGWEPCTIDKIKAYKPESNSLGSGQVLHQPYPYDQAKTIIKEMADLLSLDLLDKKLVTDQIVLTIGYDRVNLEDPKIAKGYKGEVTKDHYGRAIPKHAHGTQNLDFPTSSTSLIVDAAVELFDRIVDKNLFVRRVNIVANHVVSESSADYKPIPQYEQIDLFTDYEAIDKQREDEEQALKKERDRQEAILHIRKKFGKNAILKGLNFQEGATTKERNQQIGGHKA